MAEEKRNYFDPMIVNRDLKHELLAKIDSKCNVTGSEECTIWTASVNSAGYPQMKLGKKFSHLFTDKPYNPVGIAFAIQHSLVLNQPFHEISHLCHEKKCVRVGHISYEPCVVNVQRNGCKANGMCFTHQGYPDCIM